MEIMIRITLMSSAVREFIAPRYRPELYYMRGPGPAHKRRMERAEALRHGPFSSGDETRARH